MRKLLTILFLCASIVARGQTWSYSYWFDANTDQLHTGSFTGNSMQTDIPTDGLSDWFHTLHIQMTNDEGDSTPVLTRTFAIVPTSNVDRTPAKYRYWFDGDEANMQTGTMTGNTFSMDVPTEGLTDWFHLMHYQVQDVSGQWSPVLTRTFAVIPQKTAASRDLTGQPYRYWFDDDETTMQTGTLTSNVLELETITEQLPSGIHYFHLQVCDDQGNWSSVLSREFKVGMQDILPWGTEEPWESKYIANGNRDNYTEPSADVNGRNWTELGYDDSSWQMLSGPVANNTSVIETVNFNWPDEVEGLNLRRAFTMDSIPEGNYQLLMKHDDAVRVYLNSQLVVESNDCGTDFVYDIPSSALRVGENLLAIYIDQFGGNNYLDYCLRFIQSDRQEEPGPYAVLSENNTLLTFYYDEKKKERGGISFQSGTDVNWPSSIRSVTQASFDESFAGFMPTSTSYWFAGFSSLTSIMGMEYLNTSNVTDMSSMFNGCSSLTTLDLGNFNTSLVANMNDMFANSTSLTTIYVTDVWTTEAAERNFAQTGEGTHRTFQNCTQLVGGAGTKYDENDHSAFKAHIDGGPDNPGYLTDKNAANDSIIQFADTAVKSLCVQNWDTNGDGELSYKEAAVVTDLGEVFRGNTEIVSFSELEYFTGLTAIGDYAFYHCENLQKVIMPQTITKIGHDAFNDCRKLVSADIPSGVKEIDYQAFIDCSSLTSFVVPDGVTTITYNAFTGTGVTSIVPPGYEKDNYCGVIPESVTTIANQALLCYNLVSVVLPAGVQKLDGNPFVGCNALQELKVEEGNQYFHAEGNCIIETATNTVSVGTNYSVIPSYAKIIGYCAFCNLNYETFEVPEGIVSVEESAFNNSFYLTEVTLPSTLTNLDGNAFYACRKLTTLKVKMRTPIVINDIFKENALTTLYVPYGTAERYRNAEIWKNFQHIIEMEPVGDVTFDERVLAVGGSTTMNDALEAVGGREEVAKSITAIVWNSNIPLTNDDLQGLNNPNMLIYVYDESLAPQNRDNIIIGNDSTGYTAKNIVLTDVNEGNGNFYCPQTFKAEMVSYTHEYRQQTEIGVARGWETIALPFTVQTIMHEKNGLIAPFGNDASEKHFWLRQLSERGLARATVIEANMPYLISMPNSNEYPAEYNQAGRVTFSAQDAIVPQTEINVMEAHDINDNMVMFVPCFQSQSAEEQVYALNVGEQREGYPEGSVFVANYRNIRPFEAFTVHHGNGPAPQYIPIFDMNGGTTGIENVRSKMEDGRGSIWYDLHGRKLQQKPSQKGVYILNGQKTVIK